MTDSPSSPVYSSAARTPPRIGGPSPWGLVQHVEVLADGVIAVGTASHGGIWLSTERLAQMPADRRSRDGWYEEDCEAAFPLQRFLADIHFTDERRREGIEQYIAAMMAHCGGAFSKIAMNR